MDLELLQAQLAALQAQVTLRVIQQARQNTRDQAHVASLQAMIIEAQAAED